MGGELKNFEIQGEESNGFLSFWESRSDHLDRLSRIVMV